MFSLDSEWIEITCPKCRYIFDVQLVEVKCERLVYCHNCKIPIKLVDSEGSVHHGFESINNAIGEFEQIIKKFGK